MDSRAAFIEALKRVLEASTEPAHVVGEETERDAFERLFLSELKLITCAGYEGGASVQALFPLVAIFVPDTGTFIRQIGPDQMPGDVIVAGLDAVGHAELRPVAAWAYLAFGEGMIVPYEDRNRDIRDFPKSERQRGALVLVGFRGKAEREPWGLMCYMAVEKEGKLGEFTPARVPMSVLGGPWQEIPDNPALPLGQ